MQKAGVSERIGAALLAIVTGLGALTLPPAALAQAAGEDWLPQRRLMLESDTDRPGGDIAQHFDISLEACLGACLADAGCDSLTYNQRSRACFPKAGAPAPSLFAGALSGRVVAATPEARALARRRAEAAPFLQPEDLRAALAEAEGAATRWQPGAGDPRAALAAEAQSRWADAVAAFGPLVAADDRAGDWVTLARMANGGGDDGLAASAAINGWLRAEADDVAARALLELSRAWGDGRGRDALAALRLAAQLSSDAGIGEALIRGENRWGMRVTDNEVDADSARPSFCVRFSRPLSESLDYTPYLRLPPGDLTVEAQGERLCITGLAHGSTVDLRLRAGLPAGDGEVLDRDVDLTAYVRDRRPAVRFPGRAYVLPAGGDRGLEVATVNVDALDLRLSRIADGNLIGTLRDDLFARPLDGWSASWLDDQMAVEVWTGSADLPVDDSGLNREVTTRLAIPEAAGPLAPGVYVLRAQLPELAGQGPDYDRDAPTAAAQWFLISDLGISTLWGTNELTVVVRGLSDAGPREGVEVALVSRANAELGRALTDAEGVVRFDAALTRGTGGAAPAMVMVTDWDGSDAMTRRPRDMAFLSLLDPEFDLSDRGVAGLPAPGPIDVFLTSDRGVYRPGETVHVTALARDSAARAIRDLPMTVQFLRPDGVEAARLRIDPDAAGGYVFDLPIDAQAPRGTWRVEMRAEDKGPALASARLLVEDFLPERIDFTLDLPEGPRPGGETLAVAGQARWLFGAPAAGLPWEAWLGLTATDRLPGYDNFRFGLPDGRTASLDSIASGTTGADGGFAFDARLPAVDRVSEASLRTEVREGAGRPVERSETRTLLPDSPVFGIRTLFDGDTVSEGTEARFELIAVAPDLTRHAAPARWVLTRLETEYLWYRAGSRWNWEVVTHRRRVDGGEVQITADRPASLSLPVDWGQYELRIEAGDGSGAAAVTFWSGWAMAGAGSESPDRLEVRLDAPAYRAGDTARLTIAAEDAGTAIVSVLTNRVVDMRIVPLTAGENEVALNVTEEWGGGAYVTASALRPLADEAATPDHAPVRRLGIAHAPVDPGERRMQAEIEVAAQSRPRGLLPVTLRLDGVPEGEVAQASIAVVDQGILNLTGFKSPDPQEHYFGQHRLGVGLRDLYGRLLLATGAPDGRLREGGDAQGGLDTAAPPPTEVLMAWFSGPVTVGADGTATVEVPIPDFNGEVRVMAVAWTETAIGQAEATAQIRDPVVLMVTAPQFLAPGDSTTLQLELTQAEGAGETALALEATPGQLLPDLSALPASVTLTEGEARRLRLPVSVPADAPTGTAHLQFSLTAPDGSVLGKDIAIPIMDGAPETLRRTRITVTPGQPVDLDGSDSAGLRDISRMTLTAGPFASLDIGSVLGDLARYPYGCTEQIASAALPLIDMPDLMQTVLPEAERPDTAEALGQAVVRVLARQNADGGFGMWGASYDSDLWLDAYATGFLARARAAGQVIPETAWQMALANLRNRVNYATTPTAADKWENASLAQAVLVLARERAASIGDLRYYADAAAEGFATPLSSAQIGAALALNGDRARGQRMLDQALAQTDRPDEPDRGLRWDYGSDLRDRAMVLALAVEAGLDVPDLDARIRQLAGRIDQRRRGWLSTQESAALIELAQALRTAPPALNLDGQRIAQAITPLIAGQDVHLEAEGAPIDVTLTAFGRLVQPDPAGGVGYRITRRYFDMQGAPVDIAQTALGARLAVVIEVTPDPGTPGGRLIIDDPLPAGFEIDNPDLIEAGSDAALAFGDTTEPDMAQFLRERFIASTTWTSPEVLRLVYVVRAVHEGSFAHPAAMVSDMYRPQMRAWTDAGHVTIAD